MFRFAFGNFIGLGRQFAALSAIPTCGLHVSRHNMNTEKLISVVRDILNPMCNELSRREAGRIIRREDLIGFAELYKNCDSDGRTRVLSLLAQSYGTESKRVIEHCHSLALMGERQA